MPQIIIEDLEFYGYHGVYEREGREGTKYKLTAVVEIDELPCFKSDEVDDALNYEFLIGDILELACTKRVKLLERLCDAMVERLLTYAGVRSVDVKLSKWLHAAGSESFWVAVRLKRARSGNAV
ncbi:MAG: dihydroneopterin aldolase [Bradymonadales bacterium]|jgi:dihydroneopterin aldolase